MSRENKTEILKKISPEYVTERRKKKSSLLAVPVLAASGDSHSGMVRSGNEDNFVYFISDEKCSCPSVFMAVADGVGGHCHGDVASALTLKLLVSSWREFASSLDASDGVEAVVDFMKKAVRKANSSVFDVNVTYSMPSPMGTTLAALVLLPGFALTFHAGDSRIYVLRNGALKRLTRDHSVVADLIAKGEITEEEAENHPMSHVIYRSIGGKGDVLPEVGIFGLEQGDKFLVCSDGLMLHVTDKEIENVMKITDNFSSIVSELIRLALRRGGRDNVTIVCGGA